MIPATLLVAYNDTLPTVTSIAPSVGSTTGGTAITLTGKGFLTAKNVTFGGNAVGSFTIVNDTSITFSAPAHAAGTGITATVVTDSGSATGGTYEYLSVTPGSTTFDSGSGSYVVPNYLTLVVELWGGGSPGCGLTSPSTHFHGSPGGNSSVSTLSLAANGAQPTSGTGGGVPGAGGTASGGDTNTSGTVGGSPGSYNGSTIGAGGGSPNGGATRPPPVGQGVSGLAVTGLDGNAPGGGGTAPTYNVSGSQFNTAGGSGGGYCKKTYTLGAPGAPSIGASLSYAVGSGGAANTGGNFDPGNGVNGRIKFTVS